MSLQIAPTPSERLFLARRRAGKTQSEVAGMYNVGLFTYGTWETGAAEPPKEAARIALGRLKPHEQALLARRRAGKTQKELARKMKCSRYHINRMERGEADAEPLLKFWNK